MKARSKSISIEKYHYLLRLLDRGWTIPAIARAKKKNPRSIECHAITLKKYYKAKTLHQLMGIAYRKGILKVKR